MFKIVRCAWRVVKPHAYARDMGRHRGPGRGVEPARRPAELDEFRGKWVAVKDGKVIAAAATSLELVSEVRRQGPRAQGAVAQYVPEASNTIIIGVG